MSSPFAPADTDAWIAHGVSPVQAAALANAWRRFPDLANDSPLDQRMARMRERVTALRPVMEAMAHMVEAERQARNFAFTARRVAEGRGRSEEHTSELQSLMRISYAVFCLKKKNKYNKNKVRETNKRSQHTTTR